MRSSVILLAVAVVLAQPLDGQLRTANLGRCDLELGGVIEECRLAYQTHGQLGNERSNAVLIPTWFTGRASAWLPMLGPEGAVDTTTHFVVVVESLGAGSSSSPVTSSAQPGLAFPEITVGDMVAASYRLVREELGLDSLFAVVGVSLGGLQAFEWAVRHPEFVGRIVPIVGTPRQAPYQRAMWQMIADAAQEGASLDEPDGAVVDRLAHLLMLGVASPTAVNGGSYEGQLAQRREQVLSSELLEWAWQARAILRFDATQSFGGSMERAAEAWNGPALVIVAEQDHSISPEPALEFGRLLGAELLVLPDPEGHVAFSKPEVQAAVRRFLSR